MASTSNTKRIEIVAGCSALAFVFIFPLILILSTAHHSHNSSASKLAQIQTGCLAYYTEYSEWPQVKENAELMKILEGNNPRKIAFLTLRPDDVDSSGAAIDQWGTPYRITIDSNSNVHVTSAGPDKIFGTADDITNQ